MKRSISFSLPMSALLSVAVASAASGATLSAPYTLLSTPVGTATAGYTSTMNLYNLFNLKIDGWSSFSTNASGLAIIEENAASNGQNLFLLDPAHPSNGLVAVGPQSIYISGSSVVAYNTGVSDQGAVAGYSFNSGSATAWVYTPGTGGGAGTNTTIANTGDLAASNYKSNGSYSQYTNAVAGAGWTVGYTNRYSGTTQVGADAWFYNPNKSAAGAKVIPLIDTSSTSNYKATVTISGSSVVYQNSSANGVDDAGLIAGTSTRYMNKSYGGTSPTTTYGSDAWVYNGAASSLATTATQIGLLQNATTTPYSLQSVYSNSDSTILRNTAIYTMSPTGTIGGATSVYNSTTPTSGNAASVGTIAWLYTPGTTPGTASVSYTSPTVNSFAATGSVSDGSGGNYIRVGLYRDAAHQNAAGIGISSVFAINSNGQATGLSNIFSSTNQTSIGSADAWYFDGSAGDPSVLINPITASTQFSLYYNYSNGTNGTGVVRRSTLTSLNSNGWVAGYSTRFALSGGAVYSGTSPTTLGQDAWVFDADTKTTFVLGDGIGGADDTSSSFSSTVQYLTNSGIALGYYSINGGANSLFAWYNDGSANGKFYTIGSAGFLSNSLSSAHWASLASLVSIDANGNLYGIGVTSSGTNAVFELQATPSTVLVPEPTALGLLAIGTVGLLARRRKA